MNSQKKLIAFCQYCNSQFFPLRTSGKFCSDKCKQAAYRNRLEEKEFCKIYTIGYEGKGLQSFVEILQANKIKQLIDIRDSTNGSFRADFNEDNIKYTLKREGIKYII